MHSYSIELGGRTLTMEIGKIAKQANGAVLVRYGDTAVVVAATGTKTPREGVDFFPLTVDFEEKMYAVGKIPGGFIKREGRPAETAILTSRLIDRPIRPMFPEGYHNEPPDPPDVPGRLPQRRADCCHRSFRRPGQRTGYAGNDWRFLRALHFRYSV